MPLLERNLILCIHKTHLHIYKLLPGYTLCFTFNFTSPLTSCAVIALTSSLPKFFNKLCGVHTDFSDAKPLPWTVIHHPRVSAGAQYLRVLYNPLGCLQRDSEQCLDTQGKNQNISGRLLALQYCFPRRHHTGEPGVLLSWLKW